MTIRARSEERLWTVKTPTVTVDDGDTTLQPFIEDFQTWLFLQPLSGAEDTIADQVMVSRTMLGTARYDSRFRDRQQLHRAGRVLEIVSMLNIDERNIELQLMLKEIV